MTTPTTADYALTFEIANVVEHEADEDTALKRIAQLLAEARTPEERHAGGLVELCSGLLRYRRANTLNFQLEKLDDYLDHIRELLAAIEREKAEAQK